MLFHNLRCKLNLKTICSLRFCKVRIGLLNGMKSDNTRNRYWILMNLGSRTNIVRLGKNTVLKYGTYIIRRHINYCKIKQRDLK